MLIKDLCHGCTVRGFAKNFFSKNPRLLWKWVGGSRSHSEFFFVGKSSQNSPKPVLIFRSIGVVYHIFCLYTLLKVVGYYDFSVHVSDGFPKKKLVGGWG